MQIRQVESRLVHFDSPGNELYGSCLRILPRLLLSHVVIEILVQVVDCFDVVLGQGVADGGQQVFQM